VFIQMHSPLSWHCLWTCLLPRWWCI